MGKLHFETLKPKVLIRKDMETSPKYGCDPYKRNLKEHIRLGVVNIDKPSGPTSHQVSAYVQKILEINKSGHSGTLDPQVTGVLPVTLCKSTKIVQTLLKAGKEYVCLMHLHKEVKEYDLYKAIEKFTGTIDQLPPVKSAVKRQWRKRTIYYFEVLDIKDQDVLFTVGCQAGTYIRKLVHDIGQELGCGAHMAQLRRTKAGPFQEDTLCTLQDLTDAYHYAQQGNETFIRKLIMPVEEAVKHLPKIWVFDSTVDALCHGASLAIPGIAKIESTVRSDKMCAVFTLKNELICFGTAVTTAEAMLGNKGLAVKTDKVIMDPKIYPRMMA